MKISYISIAMNYTLLVEIVAKVFKFTQMREPIQKVIKLRRTLILNILLL